MLDAFNARGMLTFEDVEVFPRNNVIRNEMRFGDPLQPLQGGFRVCALRVKEEQNMGIIGIQVWASVFTMRGLKVVANRFAGILTDRPLKESSMAIGAEA
jgi:hypothetical protein